MLDSKSNSMLLCKDHTSLDIRNWMETPKGDINNRGGREGLLGQEDVAM